MSTTASHPKIVCFGEVLWDVLPAGAEPGGAPMNVAYHLKKLGNDPAVITRIGTDDYGDRLRNIFASSGVSTQYFQTDPVHATGLVHATPNEFNEVVYDIVQPVAWDFIGWEDRFTELLAGAELLICGSLASRNATSRETLLRLLESPPKKVLDINLRPPHFHRTWIEFLLGKADILKLNNAELELITGWFSDYTSPEERIKSLQDKFKVETIVVTMGGEGALVAHDGATWRHPGYSVQVADTIGSGDSFLAGFLHNVLAGVPYDQALTFACGLGSYIASRSGACPDYKIEDVWALIHSHPEQQVIKGVL
ncbi:MAG: carbohydrate kinase [Williamsia sp.]|nr:carbohydrate kinase [Williamsia sp.]